MAGQRAALSLPLYRYPCQLMRFLSTKQSKDSKF